jgi:hypothetical protein
MTVISDAGGNGQQPLLWSRSAMKSLQRFRRRRAYFSDRGRLFQADRGRQDCVAVAALGERAGTGLTVAESSTISLKRAAVGRVSGSVLSPI